jgi:predicted secreted protein
MTWRPAGRAWPPVALALLLGATLLQVRTAQVWHLDAPIFIALIFVAAIGGWILGLLVERFISPRSTSGEAGERAASPVAAWAPRAVRAILFIAFAAVVVASVWYLAHHFGMFRIDAIRLGLTGGAAFVAGGAARSWFGSRAVVTQLVIAAAVAAWGYYDAIAVPYRPFRDVQLYLQAGAAWLDGQAVYLAGPLTVMPSDPTRLPFVYPPFLLPFFGALSRLPQGLAIALWEIAAVAAVILALKLLGVRSRWIPLLLLWPSIAVGLSVGNAAPFGFLGLAAGWRWGAALVLGGMFKAQAAIPALWLLRERRWRPFVFGCMALAVLGLVTLPLTGLAIYGDWLKGLQAFEETVRRFPTLAGAALQHYLPQGLAVAIAVVAAAAAAAASGRMGLSRFGVVAIVASPTLYVHGLVFLLPAALWLDATSLWLILGLVPIGWGVWLAIAATSAALILGLTRGAIATRWSRAGTPEHAELGSPLHLLGPDPEPWPDPGA